MINWMVLTTSSRQLSGLGASAIQEQRNLLRNSLLNASISFLDAMAVELGNLAGCNAIFWEFISPVETTSVANVPSSRITPASIQPTANPTTGSTAIAQSFDLRQLHGQLHKAGFRMLEIDYATRRIPAGGVTTLTSLSNAPGSLSVSAATSTSSIGVKATSQGINASAIASKRPQILLVFLTNRIPRMPYTDSADHSHDKHYIPNKLLQNLVDASFKSSAEIYKIAGRADIALRINPTQEMLAQIDLRERIPLLDLPWDARGRSQHTLVDLWEDWDEDLFRRFWSEFLEPNFEDGELEPVDQWRELITSEEALYDLHVVLALKWEKSETLHGVAVPQIAGGIVFEYHPEANNGLITYLFITDTTGAVPRRATGEKGGLDQVLLEGSIEILDWNAKARGNIVGCNVIFLETYLPGRAGASFDKDHPSGAMRSRSGSFSRERGASSPLGLRAIDDVTENHQVLSDMGFRLISFQYVLPPVCKGQPKSTQFMLTAFVKPYIDAGILQRNNQLFLPSSVIQQFVSQQWQLAKTMGRTAIEYHDDPDFQRMMRQLKIREQVPLLELPWIEGVWTFVDMWEDFDEKLLRTFYEEVMIPAYPIKEELEPLDIWLTALSDEVRHDPDSLDLHCLLAIKWPSADSKAAHPIIYGGCIFEYYSHINCALISYLVVRKKNDELLKNLINEAIEIINATAKGMGHIAGCNCIFWEEKAEQHLHHHTRNKSSIGNAAAVTGPPTNPPTTTAETPAPPAKEPKADGVKVTISSAQSKADAKAAESLTANHRLSHALGFRQVDIQYIVPPVAPQYPHKLRNWLLAVLVTPNIPRIPFVETEKYCIPSVVLKNFLSSIWRSAFVTGRITSPPDSDADFRRICKQVNVRQNIPLLELPWNIKQWTMVDLYEDFDEDLLKQFYEHLLVPNFPIEGELEPLDVWLDILRHQHDAKWSDNVPELHVLLAMKWLDDGTAVIGGGGAAEYYRSNNCGLITYLVVHKSGRGTGLARIMVEHCVEILDTNARSRGMLAGCNSVFLETNAAEKVTMQQDVMDPRMRHVIYHKIGFRMLDFAYVMPPLGQGQSKMDILLLTVYITSHIPKNEYDDRYYLPAVLLQRFIKGQWAGARAKKYIGPESLEDLDYLRMIQQTDVREKVPLFDLPWGSGKPWIVVDLWEDLDEDLMETFYEDYLSAKVNDLEPLDNWRSALMPEGEQQKYYDLHVLIAFNITGEVNNALSSPISPTKSEFEQDIKPDGQISKDKGTVTLNRAQASPSPMSSPGANQSLSHIIGGLVFEYYHITNCTLVTYMAVDDDQSNDFNRNLAIGMMQKMVKIADGNAKDQGHIAGCSSIFLECARVRCGNLDISKINQDVPAHPRAKEPKSRTQSISPPLQATPVPMTHSPMSAQQCQIHGPPATAESLQRARESHVHRTDGSPGMMPFDTTIQFDTTSQPQGPPPNLLIQAVQAATPKEKVASLSQSLAASPTGPQPVFSSFEALNRADPLHPTFLFSQGFRLLNFPYYQPPVTAHAANVKARPLLLSVFVTQRIPFDAEKQCHYIPPTLLQSFITNLWEEECALNGYDYENDEQFKNMMALCHQRQEENGIFHILDDWEWGVEASECDFESMRDVIQDWSWLFA